MIKRLLIIAIFFITNSILFAQTTDSAKVKNETGAKPPKQKEIKKLDDPLLQLDPDLIERLKRMTPNQLLVINERFVRNERRADETGEQYEVTVTVRLGFSQDMITGIVKEVPLYQSAARETNIIPVKIPVKFCCTTKIDSVHTKKHCGKMSELNDFEDIEHCKDWIQEEGGSSASTTIKPKKPSSGKPTVADSTGFGKPVPKEKPSKKEIKNQKKQNNSDSTETQEQLPVPKNKKETKSKKNKTEADKDNENVEAEEFGKPKPKPKNSKTKKEKVATDSTKTE